MGYVGLSKEVIFELLHGLDLFFGSLCADVFKEDIEEAEWNYDKYFIEEVDSYIKKIENLSGA